MPKTHKKFKCEFCGKPATYSRAALYTRLVHQLTALTFIYGSQLEFDGDIDSILKDSEKIKALKIVHTWLTPELMDTGRAKGHVVYGWQIRDRLSRFKMTCSNCTNKGRKFLIEKRGEGRTGVKIFNCIICKDRVLREGCILWCSDKCAHKFARRAMASQFSCEVENKYDE